MCGVGDRPHHTSIPSLHEYRKCENRCSKQASKITGRRKRLTDEGYSRTIVLQHVSCIVLHRVPYTNVVCRSASANLKPEDQTESRNYACLLYSTQGSVSTNACLKLVPVVCRVLWYTCYTWTTSKARTQGVWALPPHVRFPWAPAPGGTTSNARASHICSLRYTAPSPFANGRQGCSTTFVGSCHPKMA
ncbi:hypothetical protein Krac_8488 [Ktedonobacter racemifer DSM 44963]|uniref:Uncharacterized protein n=1 Tax=Ktedonobacter racemifer DSM 44963 TaxID=485913 RepID=D6TN11_KTERA|nr:hypothetical protein Krac_8488 [Ktedonobacter racemifer DSM 44963]